MLASSLALRSVFLLLAVLTVWAVLPSSTAASASRLGGSIPARAVFFTASAIVPIAPTPPASPLALPSSVMPHNTAVCSSDLTNNPTRCSVFGNQNPNKCSAHCDSDQRCSAFQEPINQTGNVFCSVFSKNNRACSVLLPLQAQVAPSFCSAENNDPNSNIACSILGPGIAQKCSSQNPETIPGNFCSARSPAGVRTTCSVLRGGNLNQNFCSTKNPGSKTCSSFGAGPECSVFTRGRCTNFSGAPTGSCSSHFGPNHCSVIGGAAGTFCIQ